MSNVSISSLFPLILINRFLHRTCRSTSLVRFLGDVSAAAPCGLCDNCTRDMPAPETDVTSSAAALVRFVAQLESTGDAPPPAELVATWRAGRARKRKKRKDEDIEEEPTWPLAEVERPPYSREDCEAILVRLVADDYLREKFTHNAYATNTYIVAGRRAEELLRGEAVISIALVGKVGEEKRAKKKKKGDQSEDDD